MSEQAARRAHRRGARVNDDRLEELLRALPPAPQRWVKSAYEVPSYAQTPGAGDESAEDDGYDDHRGSVDEHWRAPDHAQPYDIDPADESIEDPRDDTFL